MAKNEEKDVKTSSKKETKKKNTLKSNEVKKVAKVTKKETISKKKSNIEKKEKTKISDTTSSKKTSSTHRKIKPTAKPMLAEYYDLPYRYNQTIVKQDLFWLFIILLKIILSKLKLMILQIVGILELGEPNCDYVIELGRKYNDFANGDYIYINSSNDILSPNDHILFENMDLKNVLFKNVKTSRTYSKDKLYGNIYDIYHALYNDEFLNKLSNPSSGEFIMK